jgi:uncharacterized membrane protein YfhO
VDEKEIPIVKVNYVLRGLVVPAGDHKIRFEFKPDSIANTQKLAGVASILLWLGLIASIALAFKEFTKKQNTTT